MENQNKDRKYSTSNTSRFASIAAFEDEEDLLANAEKRLLASEDEHKGGYQSPTFDDAASHNSPSAHSIAHSTHSLHRAALDQIPRGMITDNKIRQDKMRLDR